MTTLRAAAFVTALLVLPVSAADAGKVVPRRETQTAPYVAAYETNMMFLGTVTIGGARFKPPAWARYVSVRVVDDTSPKPAFRIVETSTYPGRDRGAYCGQTPGAVPILTTQISVDVNQGPCPDGSVNGVATKGTIEVVFSDVR